MRVHLEAKKQLLGGFAGDTGFSAKADLGLFRAPAEINSENHPELQAHVKIRPVFLQNGPELQSSDNAIEGLAACARKNHRQAIAKPRDGNTNGTQRSRKPADQCASIATHKARQAHRSMNRRPGPRRIRAKPNEAGTTKECRPRAKPSNREIPQEGGMGRPSIAWRNETGKLYRRTQP